MIAKILKLIPIKLLVKQLPQVLAFILTRVLMWVSLNYPHKTAKVKETTQEVTAALTNALKASNDGVITKEEIEVQKELWKKVFE